MPNPLTDELSDEAKAWLAVRFAQLREWTNPYNPATQRLINKTWHLSLSERWR